MLTSLALMSVLVGAAPTKDRLAEAHDLVDAFQFDKAIKVIETALQQPDLDHDSLVSLYELLAVSLATIEKPAKATAAFQLLLTIDPEHQLSKNLTPRARTPFFEARTQIARLGHASLTPDPIKRTDGLVTELGVTVTDNALLPARAVRFVVAIDGGVARTDVVKLEKGVKHATVAAKGSRVSWSAELLGDRTAVLQKMSRDELPPAPVVVDQPPAAPPLVKTPVAVAQKEGPWLRPAGVVLTILGGGALITGAIFGAQSSSARTQLDNASRDASGTITGLNQRQASALDATARSTATIADVLFIAGGTVAATGLLFIIFGGRPDGSTPIVSLSPLGVSFAGVF